LSESYPTVGPHIENKDTIEKNMWSVILALTPAVIAAVILFGPYALYLTVGTALICVVLEIPFLRNQLKLRRPLADGSAAVAGLLLGLTFPPQVPWWIPVVGAVLTILIGKQLFGGLGNNIFNPALVARGILLLSWPVYMTSWITPFDAVTSATPLEGLNAEYVSLFWGNVPGSIGETSAAALLIGVLFLYFLKKIDLRIPFAYILSSVLTALFLGVDPLFTILSGGLLFGAFFMATDMVTSPVTHFGAIVYGVGCGVLTVFIREYTIYPEGVTFAILIMNGASYLLDSLLEGPKFGEVNFLKRRFKVLGAVTAGTIIFVLIVYSSVFLLDIENQNLNKLFAENIYLQEAKNYFPEVESISGEKSDQVEAYGYIFDNEQKLGVYYHVKTGGFNGPVDQLVFLDTDYRIVGNIIMEHNETPSIGARINEDDFLAQFIDITPENIEDSLAEIDLISGATISSRAVSTGISGIYDLLDTDEQKENVSEEQYMDGEYSGAAAGLNDKVEVLVKVEEGKINYIEVLNHSDTASLAEPAFEEMTEQIKTKQSLEVDTVSGATASTQGLLNAVKDALTGQ